MLLFVVLAVNSAWFQIYVVTRSYSSRLFLCALASCYTIIVFMAFSQNAFLPINAWGLIRPGTKLDFVHEIHVVVPPGYPSVADEAWYWSNTSYAVGDLT